MELSVLVLIISALVFSTGVNSTPTRSQEINIEKIDDYLNYVETNNGGIGSVSIFKNGQEIYNKSFGQRNLPAVSYNEKTKYQIASVTKLVTAILAFKLIEEGRLNLDDKLSEYYPEIPNSKKITIQNLLEHSSGLGNFAIRNGSIWVIDKVNQEEIFEEIKKQGVNFEPSEKVAYSNSAYFLLRMILERKYEDDYHKIVEKEIAKPFHLDDFVSTKSKPINTFKSYTFAAGWTEIKDIEYSNVIGVGDIASTTRDLNLLIVSLFQYKILREETLEIMKPILGKEGWGRGLAEFAYGENIFFGHGGDVLGSHSRLIYNPKDEIAIAYSTNGERIPTNIFLETIVSIIYHKEFKPPEIK